VLVLKFVDVTYYGTGISAWAHRVRLDRAELRRYAQAVYTSTDGYIAALAEDALNPTRGDMLVCLLSGLLLSLSMRRGEITCLRALSCGRRA